MRLCTYFSSLEFLMLLTKKRKKKLKIEREWCLIVCEFVRAMVWVWLLIWDISIFAVIFYWNSLCGFPSWLFIIVLGQIFVYLFRIMLWNRIRVKVLLLCLFSERIWMMLFAWFSLKNACWILFVMFLLASWIQ